MTEKEKKKHEKNLHPEVEKTEERIENQYIKTEKPETHVTDLAQDEPEMVTIPLKEYASQLEELEDLRKKVDEFSEGWQRERADFSNYRKRVLRDQEAEKSNSRIEIIKKYLEIHDDLERALKNLPEVISELTWIDGIRLIDQKLNGVLESEGVQPILAEGQEFNPELHEAISNEDHEEIESGKIIEVVQKGYTLGDRVIRPARVRVSK